MEQWQFEVTSGGRIWYAIDDRTRTLWLTHPAQTVDPQARFGSPISRQASTSRRHPDWLAAPV
jgi:hypothetical protein